MLAMALAQAEAREIIREIMRRRGSPLTVDEFHNAVNVTFHEFESEQYDHGHQNMWQSLPEQFELLSDDILRGGFEVPPELRLLDIGCGTGLATDCLLKTGLGKRVREVTLLDTSPSMLRRAAERSSTWNVPCASHLGQVESMVGKGRYELIITCSVLHHVLDLRAFFATVGELQTPNGYFLHLQDPNGDYLNDPELGRRTEEQNKRLAPEWLARFAPSRIAGRLKREISGTQGDDYISRTNKVLMEKGAITSPMAVSEIFAITDLHAVPSEHQGVSISAMKASMPEYECVTTRAYAFFGVLRTELPPHRQKIEQELIAKKAPNGYHIAAAWRRVAPGDGADR
jgi:2-polyprenyl-3-methyl-5-hydroxy-6-metoxy-1,4-benzoquinol methylase